MINYYYNNLYQGFYRFFLSLNKIKTIFFYVHNI